MSRSALNVDSYLDRIGFAGLRDPTLETLRRLHRTHLLAVPFENLDIHIPREIVLDVGRLYGKIVGERRGGFCYELNGLFAALLRELGFTVTLLSARVPRPGGGLGPEFDHLCLRVDLDEPWLVDVGFGDSFREPVRLLHQEQEQDGERWRIDDEGEHLALMRNSGDGWSRQYAFTLQLRDLSEFAEMCRYHQTSADSHFTRNRVCSIATPDGRISLTSDRLIVTRGRDRQEISIETDERWRETLLEQFGIELSRSAAVTL
jgi:N-hydroxyarylamine O-acetyltransferase